MSDKYGSTKLLTVADVQIQENHINPQPASRMTLQFQKTFPCSMKLRMSSNCCRCSNPRCLGRNMGWAGQSSSQRCEAIVRLARSMTSTFSTTVNFSMKGTLEECTSLTFYRQWSPTESDRVRPSPTESDSVRPNPTKLPEIKC